MMWLTRTAFPVLGLSLAVFSSSQAAETTFDQLLARAHAEDDAGRQWAPPGDNEYETLLRMINQLSTANPSQLTEFDTLLRKLEGRLAGNGTSVLLQHGADANPGMPPTGSPSEIAGLGAPGANLAPVDGDKQDPDHATADAGPRANLVPTAPSLGAADTLAALPPGPAQPGTLMAQHEAASGAAPQVPQPDPAPPSAENKVNGTEPPTAAQPDTAAVAPPAETTVAAPPAETQSTSPASTGGSTVPPPGTEAESTATPSTPAAPSPTADAAAGQTGTAPESHPEPTEPAGAGAERHEPDAQAAPAPSEQGATSPSPPAPPVIQQPPAPAPAAPATTAATEAPPVPAPLPVTPRPAVTATQAPGGSAASTRPSLPNPRPTGLSPAYVTTLFNRGVAAEAAGDISGAKRFYTVAADQGHAGAARALSRLYDPTYLKHNSIGGIDADADASRRWSERADALEATASMSPTQALSAR